MPTKRRLWLASALAGCVIVWPMASWCPARAATLARSVPADARLFLEWRGTNSFWAMPASSALARLAAGLVTTTNPAPETQPGPGPFGWQKLFAEAVGLDDNTAADLLLTGPVALAADGWSGLGDAILLAAPADPAALEAELTGRGNLESAGRKVRRYQLAHDHELACDGRTVLVGRSTNRSGIYLRTIALLESDHGVALGDVAAFREQTSRLPAGAQLVFYAGTNSRTPTGGAVLGSWWPAGWPALRSVAVAVVVTTGGVTVETHGQLDLEGRAKRSSDAPIQSLLRLPASTVAAWTHPIDYAEAFGRLDADYLEGSLRFLQSGLPPGAIEQRLLKHLVGDSVVMIGRVTSPPPAMKGAKGQLLLPTVAVAVETDDPHTVQSMMGHLASSFLESLELDLESFPEDDIPVEYISLEPGEEAILSIHVGRLLFPRSGCPLLRSLQISWTVADRWLVIGTHAGTVREMVEARRGQGPALPAEAIPDVMGQVSGPGAAGKIEMLLVARPSAASEMIDSWIAYVSHHHPEMLQRDWWRRLRRKQWLTGVQLGVLPTPRALVTGVEVGETLPNYPAHGRLQPGDQILAVDGQPLDSEQPLPSLREKLVMRERADAVTLRVLRDGQEQDVEIPMSAEDWDAAHVHPVALLRQAADVLRVFSSAAYAVRRPSPDSLHARLELRFASSAAPTR